VTYERPGSVSRLGLAAECYAALKEDRHFCAYKILGGPHFSGTALLSSHPAYVSRPASLTQFTHSLLWTRDPDFDGFLMQPTVRRPV
jgi:hypothetical protein